MKKFQIATENYGAIESEVGSSSRDSAGVTITAGTPSDFETRNIGVEMTVTPVVEENNCISLQLRPKVTEFEGFVEYGGRSIAIQGNTTVDVPPGFYQPIFSTREIQTEVTIYNGATVVMGGLTREEIREVHDKVPFLGDIPLFGKLFRSKGKTSQKKNLLIFVTANILSPGGVPILKDQESQKKCTNRVNVISWYGNLHQNSKYRKHTEKKYGVPNDHNRKIAIGPTLTAIFLLGLSIYFF